MAVVFVSNTCDVLWFVGIRVLCFVSGSWCDNPESRSAGQRDSAGWRRKSSNNVLSRFRREGAVAVGMTTCFNHSVFIVVDN